MYDIEIPLFSVRRDLVSGMASAVRNLIAGLMMLGKSIALPYTNRDRLPCEYLEWLEQKAEGQLRFHRYPSVPGGMPARFIEETIYNQLRPRNTPILFPNYFLPPRLLGRRSGAAVFIYDCIHREHPELLSRRKFQWIDWNYRRTLDRADRVLLISEFEKGQIARYYGERATERCLVTYIPVDWSRYYGAIGCEDIRRLAEKPYILCIAHPYPHKNLVKTLKAYLRLPSRFRDYRLIIAGKASQEIMEYLDNNALERDRARIRVTGFVPDSDLGCLLKNASLYVSASSYEGFGMPAVEAIGLGVPTLVTGGAAMEEVTLGKASYCADLPDPDVWSEAIAHALDYRKPAADYELLAAEIRERYSPVTIAKTVLSAMGLTRVRV